MTQKQLQIIPIGGGGFYRDPENLELEKYLFAKAARNGAGLPSCRRRAASRIIMLRASMRRF